MTEDFLGQTFYGNTVFGWLTALAIIVGALIVGKLVYWVFGNIVKQLTKKTKTKLDDIIIDMIEEPIVFTLPSAVFGTGSTCWSCPRSFTGGWGTSFIFSSSSPSPG